MRPLTPDQVACAIRSAWTSEETYGSRVYWVSHAGNNLQPIRGRRVYVSREHVKNAWTPEDLLALAETDENPIEDYTTNAHAGRMN
jgi:hypothetical protein